MRVGTGGMAEKKRFQVQERGDRLNPGRTHTRYVHLTALRGEMEYVVENYLRDGKDRTILDFGCGNMPYRRLFDGCGTYIGADLPGNDEAEIDIAEDGRIGGDAESADVVLSTQVLEHVYDPSVYLRECLRVLRPGGLLILSTHGYWMYHGDPNDYWRWTGEGLRKVIFASGLHVKRCAGLVGLAGAGVQLFQDASIRRLPRAVIPLYAFVMQCLLRVADKLFPSDQRNDAQLFVVVARKPLAN